MFAWGIILCLLLGKLSTEGTPKGSRGRPESPLVAVGKTCNRYRIRNGSSYIRGEVSPSRATKGLSDRPLETFGAPTDEEVLTCLLEERFLVLLVTKSKKGCGRRGPGETNCPVGSRRRRVSEAKRRRTDRKAPWLIQQNCETGIKQDTPQQFRRAALRRRTRTPSERPRNGPPLRGA